MSNPNRSRANSNNNAAPHGMSASARQNSSSTIQTAPTYNSQQYSAPQTFVAQQGYRTSPPMPRPSNYQQSSPLPMPPPSNYQNDRQYQSQQQLDGSQYSAQSRPSVNRTKTVMRHIPLTKQGNLVIDVPVAERIRSLGKYSHDEEFTHVRYSAATASADDFSKSGFILRQQEYGRQTEMFIVVTMVYSSNSVQRGRLPVLQINDRNHEKYRLSLYTNEFKNLGSGRMEKSRRVHCQRWQGKNQPTYT